MLPLAGGEQVHLPPAWRKRPQMPPHAEEDQLGDVAEVEADAPPVRTAVAADLVPHEIGLVGEPPLLHHEQAVCEQGVRHPQVKMRVAGQALRDRQPGDLLRGHGVVPGEPSVLGRHLAGSVQETPRRVGQHRRERPGREGSRPRRWEEPRRDRRRCERRARRIEGVGHIQRLGTRRPPSVDTAGTPTSLPAHHPQGEYRT